MTEEMDIQENDTVILVDEDGEEHVFIMLDVIEVEGAEYAILQPADDDLTEEEDEPEAIILKIETDDKGEEILADIEDDEEWEKVADAWQELVGEDSD